MREIVCPNQGKRYSLDSLDSLDSMDSLGSLDLQTTTMMICM